MNYNEAIKLLLENNAVRNNAWKENVVCIKLPSKEEDNKFILLYIANGYKIKWSPYIADLSADSWVLANDEYTKLNLDIAERKRIIEEEYKREQELINQGLGKIVNSIEDFDRFVEIKPTILSKIKRTIKKLFHLDK